MDKLINTGNKDAATERETAKAAESEKQQVGKQPVNKDSRGKGKPPEKGKGKPKRKPPKKLTTGQIFAKFLIKVVVITAAVWALLTFVLCVHIHYGNNMHPSVRDGDLTVTYRLQKPFINAVVIYELDGKKQVGRVIAMPGDVVSISSNGELTVNDVTPSEEVFYATYAADGSDIKYPYTVPDGSVFILNDFREDTNDSRTFGAVEIKELDGCALFTMRRRGF